MYIIHFSLWIYTSYFRLLYTTNKKNTFHYDRCVSDVMTFVVIVTVLLKNEFIFFYKGLYLGIETP